MPSDKLVVRIAPVFVLLPINVDARRNQGFPREKHNVSSSERHGYAGLYRKNAEFYRATSEVEGGSVRVYCYEGYRAFDVW